MVKVLLTIISLSGDVDVTAKKPTVREATAIAAVRCSPEVMRALREGTVPKGDVLAVAQVAGIQAAKHNWELIPMCHPLPLTGIDITFPAEYGENPDFIEFVSGPNGLINIELKNIGHIENR